MGGKRRSWPIGTRISVQWIDARSSDGWEHEFTRDDMRIDSVGVLIHQDLESITIAQSTDAASGATAGRMTIPRVAVVCTRKI